MSPMGVIAIMLGVALVGVLWFGFSILRSIRERSKPLPKYEAPGYRTPFDEAVHHAAEEFRRELEEARAEERKKNT